MESKRMPLWQVVGAVLCLDSDLDTPWLDADGSKKFTEATWRLNHVGVEMPLDVIAAVEAAHRLACNGDPAAMAFASNQFGDDKADSKADG